MIEQVINHRGGEHYVAPCVETISTCLNSILCGSTGGNVQDIGDGGDD